MTKPHFIDGNTMLDRQNKAIDEARSILKTRGVYFPIRMSGMSDDEYYDKLMEYSAQESALIVQILRKPIGGERPLVVDNVQPKKDWGNSWYD